MGMICFFRPRDLNAVCYIVMSKDCYLRTKDLNAMCFILRKPTFNDKKENQIFLIYREIQNGAVAKSYMANGLLKYGEIYAHFLIYSIRKPFLIDDFATAHTEFPYI